MKKFILTLIFILTVSIQGYSQTGLGYLNYRAYRTQGGGNNTWYYNGGTYGAHVNNSAEFDGMFSSTSTLANGNPANTLLGEGEVLANSSQGVAGGHPPYTNGQNGVVGGDYFAVEYTGWFYAELAGNYLFYNYADDSSETWIGGTKVAAKYGGSGNASGWITLEANTWYTYKFRYHEQTGGDFGYNQIYGPRNGYFTPGGANDVYKVSNQEPVYPHKLDVTYNLNSSLDKTKFNSWTVNQYTSVETTPQNLSSNGVINYDSEGNGLDEEVYSTGNVKSTTTNGSVEWCVVYAYDTNNKRYRVGIDKREFGTVDPTKVNHLQLFDLWDGSITFSSQDAYWANYYIYTDTELDFSNSNYSANIRSMSYGNHALQAEFTFEDVVGISPHNIHLGLDETYFTTTYPDMITIGDVAKGFSQLTNQTDSPNGPQGGIFTSDVEFILGDVNSDNSFDFLDTQMLLQHIAGETSPFTNNTINNSMFMFDGDYTNSTTSDWSIHRPTSKHFTHNLDENNKNKTKSIDVAFLGDLNLSHSSPLQSVNVSAKANRVLSLSKDNNTENTIELDMIKENGILKVSLIIPENQNNIIGTQFKVMFDTNRLEFDTSGYSTELIPSFSTKRNGYVNIGSFSSDSSTNLNSGITYTLNFKLKTELESTLGLVSLGFVEVVNKDGNNINYIVR